MTEQDDLLDAFGDGWLEEDVTEQTGEAVDLTAGLTQEQINAVYLAEQERRRQEAAEEEGAGAWEAPVVGEPVKARTQAQRRQDALFQTVGSGHSSERERAQALVELLGDDPGSLADLALHPEHRPK